MSGRSLFETLCWRLRQQLTGNNYVSAKEKGFNINWFQDEFQPGKTEMLLKIRLNVNTKFGFVLSKETLSFWAFI